MRMLRIAGVCAFLAIFSAVNAAVAAEPTGLWFGTLNAGAMKLRLGMEVTREPAGSLSVVVISLDQGDARIPAEGPAMQDGELSVPLPSIGATYQAKLSDDGQAFVGTFTQGVGMPLRMERVDRLPTQSRPQEPKPPYPYKSEEVVFPSAFAGHTLAGTLTLPETTGSASRSRAAIVLVTGSGPQDRDETLMGHKPFAVLADALTRRGVAVLRYDDRGVGESTGDFAAATTKDFAADALSAVRYLATRDDIDADRIALGGHSEGATVAPMVAAKFPKEVAALLLLAPPAISGEETIVSQGRALEVKLGMPAAIAEARATLRRQAIRHAIEAATDEDFQAGLAASVEEYLGALPEGVPKEDERKLFMGALAAYRTPWFRYFLAFDPVVALERVECPVLALIGGNDLQVLPDANLPPLRAALEAAPTDDVTVESPPGLNHLLQTSGTGSPTEYGTIEETIAPAVLDRVGDWLTERLAE